MRDFLRRGTRGTQSGSIEKLPMCLFLEGNTENTGNTVVEMNILGEFFRRETRVTQSGCDSNTTLLLCLRVEDFLRKFLKRGTQGTESGFD